MPLLQRLSPGPTVPELMRAEGKAWRREAVPRLSRAARIQACFGTASLVLAGAWLLLRLRLIEPAAAGQAFGAASRLTRHGLCARQHRRPRPRLGGVSQ